MSIEVKITLEPEARALLARAQAWPVSLMRGIARAHDLQNELTIGHAQLTKMSRRSKTTLGVVTNRLRGSLSRADARISGESVLSAIGTNVIYGGVHERGFVGTVQVKSFVRRDARKDVYGTGAASTFNWQDGKIKKSRSAKPIASGVVTVRAHPMRMNMPQRSYIQASIVDRRADYGRAISFEIIAEFTGPSA